MIKTDKKTPPIEHLACPICKENLSILDNFAQCANKHVFNIGKSGSINTISRKINKNLEKLFNYRKIQNTGIFDSLYHRIESAIRVNSNKTCPRILILSDDPLYFLSFLKKCDDNWNPYIVSASEYSEISGKYNRKNHIALHVSSINRLPFKEEFFDFIIRFDKSVENLNMYLSKSGEEIRIIEFSANFKEFRDLVFTGRNKGLRINSRLLKTLNENYKSERITYDFPFSDTLNEALNAYYEKDLKSNNSKISSLTCDHLIFTK